MLGRVEGSRFSWLFTALLLKCRALHVPSHKAVEQAVSSSTCCKNRTSLSPVITKRPWHSLLHIFPADSHLLIIPLHICSLKSLWCGQVRGKILSLPAPAARWGFAALQNIRQPEHPSTFRDVHTTRKALPAQAFDSTCRSAPSSLGGKATLTLPQTQRPREFQLNSN